LNVTPIEPYCFRSGPAHSGHSVSDGSLKDWTASKA